MCADVRVRPGRWTQGVSTRELPISVTILPVLRLLCAGGGPGGLLSPGTFVPFLLSPVTLHVFCPSPEQLLPGVLAPLGRKWC